MFDNVEEAKAQVIVKMDAYLTHLQTLTEDKVTAIWGTKFWKIILEGPWQKHVHAFIDRETGDVFKPASWAGPAKGIRYNLFTSYDELIAKCDPFGSYLYKR